MTQKNNAPDWSGTQSVGLVLHSGLEQQALARPLCPAIKQDSYICTFGQLNDWANHVAHKLLGRDGATLIAILMSHTAHQLAAAVGVWKAGMTALFLDINDPGQRLKQIVDDAGVDLIITDADLSKPAASLGPEVLNVELKDPGVASSNPELKQDPDQAAVIVYTSGSMGQPKGVVRTHRNLLREVRGEARFLGINTRDRISSLMPLNFSYGLKYALTALLNGVTLYSFSTLSKGIVPLAAWIENEGITILVPPVAYFRRFLDGGQSSGSFPTCRCVILNDKIYKRDVDRFRKTFKHDCELIHVYGCTETGGITRHVISHSETASDPIPVGWMNEGVEVRIVDPEGRDRPCGQVGEVVVGGSNLPPGYWNNPSLTKSKYRDLPGEGRGRMYFTGDTGSLREDGVLSIFGRTDSQMKIRGYRVDNSEIESLLNNTLGVSHAVVTTAVNSFGEHELLAYVSLSGEQSLDKGTLRQVVSAKLPEYMVPDIVLLEQMPSTPRGKVDREGLVEAAPSRVDKIDHRELTEIEHKLVEIWESVLEMEGIKETDDIIDLGASSLQGMVMCLKMNEIFSVDVPNMQLLATPTIEKMAIYIETQISNSRTLS